MRSHLAPAAALGAAAALALTGCVVDPVPAPSGPQDRPEQAIAGSTDHEVTAEELEEALATGFAGLDRAELRPMEPGEEDAAREARLFYPTAPDLETCLDARQRFTQAEEAATLVLHGPAPLDGPGAPDGTDPEDAHVVAYVFSTAQERHDYDWALGEAEVACDPQDSPSHVVEHEGRRLIETDLSSDDLRTLAHSMSDGNVLVWANVTVDGPDADVKAIRAAHAAALEKALSEIAGEDRHDSTPVRLPTPPSDDAEAEPDGPDAGDVPRERLEQALIDHAVPRLPEQQRGAAGTRRDPSEVGTDAPTGLQLAGLAARHGGTDRLPAQCTDRGAELMERAGGLGDLTFASVESFTREDVPEPGPGEYTGGYDEATLRTAFMLVDAPSVKSARAVAEASAGDVSALCEPDLSLGAVTLPVREGSEDVVRRAVADGELGAQNATRVSVRRGDLVAVAELSTVHRTGSDEHRAAVDEATRTLTDVLDAVAEGR